MMRYNVCPLAFASLLILTAAAGCDNSTGAARRDASSNAATAVDSAAAKSSSAAAAAGKPAVYGDLTTAHAVLDHMVEAYRKATSYEDHATVELWPEGAKEPQRADFQVVFARPNKLRMRCYQGELACDGKKWFGFSKDIPYQAVLRDAPRTINMQMLTADRELDRALNGGFAGGSPQLLFLLSERPLDMLLEGVRDQDLTLGAPVHLGDYECYRVCYPLNGGGVELWIDQKSFVLRHMQFTAKVPALGEKGETTEATVRMEANFERARLGESLDPTLFALQVPDGVECHRALLNPQSFRTIGTKLTEFKLADIQGKPWSSQSLAGKIAVLHLWRTDAPACAAVAPGIEQAYQKYKDNPRVAFFAINLDPSQVDTKTIEETARKWKLSLPILRDANFESAKSLMIADAPTTIFIDARGILQDRIRDDEPLSTAATAHKLEDLLAGKELAPQALKEANERFTRYESEVDKLFSGEVVSESFKQADATPPAAHSEPRKLKLTSLWKRNLAGIAANLLVAPVGGKPRIVVVDGFKTVTEIGLDGTIGQTHDPKLTEKELITTLRTAADRDGKQCFVAFAPWQQRIHFFDDNLKPVLSYPEDALQNPHPGITDVDLADLSGNGQINAYVGFGGSVGVKCVSLEGKQLSSCRMLFDIGRVTAGPPDVTKHRQLFCVTNLVNVAILDPKLQVSDSTKLADSGIVTGLLHADLAGDGREMWCEILFRPDVRQPPAGQYSAIGMNIRGETMWKYDLPFGTQRVVEPIVVGRLLPGTAAQWILPGCDGSIHVLAADGTLIDRFNYGAQINGLAVTEIDGKPALLIGSGNTIEALRVE